MKAVFLLVLAGVVLVGCSGESHIYPDPDGSNAACVDAIKWKGHLYIHEGAIRNERLAGRLGRGADPACNDAGQHDKATPLVVWKIRGLPSRRSVAVRQHGGTARYDLAPARM